jgi:adenosylmethionine-8-amino-7-oxononanoate aminotransferase
MKISGRQGHVFHYNMNDEIRVLNYGEGIYLFDQDGNKYIDGTGGPAVVSIGHGVKEIGEAYKKQSDKSAYVYRSHMTNKPIELFAQYVSEMTQADLDKVFFVSSGSEANEMATKMAIQYQKEKGFPLRDQIISRWGSYHGITTGALSMSGHLPRRKHYAKSLLPYPKIPAPHCYRCPEGRKYPSCDIICAHRLRDSIINTGPENVAAFLAEPIIGASVGAVTPPPEYYKIIRDICDEYEIVFIADEVMTGFGRTGKNFAMEHFQVVPDMITFGKGASSGYFPLAGIVITQKTFNTLASSQGGLFVPGHTYSGNPVGGAVGVAVIEYCRKHKLFERVNKLSPLLKEGLENLKEKHSIVGDVRGKGFLTGLEIVKDKKTREPFKFDKPGKVINSLAAKCMNNGLIIYPGSGAIDGFLGEHTLIAPPFIISESQINDMIAILDKSLAEVEKEFL